MLIPDDDRLKQYLSDFKPLSADPLPIEPRSRAARRSWAWIVTAAACLALAVAVTFALRRPRRERIPPDAGNPAAPAAVEQFANAQPLTLQQANQMLTRSQTFKAALDDVAFRRQRGDLPKGSKSALDTLGKEDIKL